MALSSSRSSAASNPHCYVAMPILPSNSKANVCDPLRTFAIGGRIAIARRDSQSLADIRLWIAASAGLGPLGRLIYGADVPDWARASPGRLT
jgi:hypothetical protein